MSEPMNEWQRERAAKLAALNALTAEVARELGEPWKVYTFDPATWEDRANDITDDQGRRISIDEVRQHSKAPAKVRISAGCWPTYTTHNGTSTVSPYNVSAAAPEIQVSRDRGPAAIAAEIRRRLLPAFFEVWAKCQARAEANTDYRALTVRNHAAICEALGLDPAKESPRHGSDDYRISLSGHVIGDGYGDVRINGDSVTARTHEVLTGCPPPLRRATIKLCAY